MTTFVLWRSITERNVILSCRHFRRFFLFGEITYSCKVWKLRKRIRATSWLVVLFSCDQIHKRVTSISDRCAIFMHYKRIKSKKHTVLTILLALIFLHEGITVPKIISVVLIGVGTLLMIDKKQDSKAQTAGKEWMIYAVLSAVFASLTAILGKVGIEGVDSNLGTAIRTTVVLVMAWLMVVVKGKWKQVKTVEKKELAFVMLSGLATGASWLCYYRALQTGQASVVVE